MLSNQYIWTTGNNFYIERHVPEKVVICFQISIFELLETTNPFRIIHKSQLWFAFKSVYLNYWKQLELIIDDILHGCDLLSNQYIWTTGNNFWYDWLLVLPVVICFQISIFELLETTLAEDTEYEEVVVICFQISIFELLETTPEAECRQF